MAGWQTVTRSSARSLLQIRRLLQMLGSAVAAWLLAAGPALAAPSGMTVQISGISIPVGMAADTDGDCYWVTDGRTATTRTLVSVDSSGRPSKSISWQAAPKDVQALAWADSTLYVGDIGDPSGDRDHIQVLSPMSLSGTSTSWRAWDFVYPDGAHDSSAMAVSPKGNIYIVTKGDSPAVYRASSELSRDSDNALVKVASAPAGVTDAVFLPGGTELALRTADQVTLLDAYSWKTLATANISATGGEAISNDLTGKGLLVSGSSTAVAGMDLPHAGDRATPSPSASAQAASSESTDSQASPRTGTLIMLIGSVLVALAAAVVVYRVR